MAVRESDNACAGVKKKKACSYYLNLFDCHRTPNSITALYTILPLFVILNVRSRKRGRGKEDNMFDMMLSGKKIADARKAKNMTQMELADLLGISYQAVSNWERGNSMPDISKLPELSELLDVSVDEILGKRSAVIENVMNDEYREDVTMDEILEAAPLLKPEQVDKNVERKFWTGQNITEIPGSVLPFLSTDFVDELFRKCMEYGVEDVSKFLPFIHTEIIDEYVRTGKGNTSFYPFASDDALIALASKKYKESGLNSIQSLAPFLPDEYINKIAEEAIEKDGIEAIVPLAPFIDHKILEKYIREQYLS